MTKQQKLIIAILSTVAIVIFAILGCFVFILMQASPSEPLPTLAAVAQQPAPMPLFTPSSTPTSSPPASATPIPTGPPSPTSTRVVTLTVFPTPSSTPANCIDDITDFEASGVITNEQVQSYLRRTIPLTHLDNCRGIRYIPKRVTVHDTPATGRFIPMFRKISVYQVDQELQNREQVLATLTHEVGHNVHFNLRIDDWDLAVRWSELHKQSQETFARTRFGFVSDYARINQFEDFAESYRAYVRAPETLKFFSPDKYEFMRQEVFNGQEYPR